ncbi:MAG: biotin transporter BioY [Acidobacteriaceae bacterium]|jgi:biotin transport system substrate-specific component
MNSLVHTVNRVATAADLSVPRSLRRPLAIVLGSLLVAVCAHVSIPLWFTPVPVTLQTFAVLLLGLLLSPAVSAAALVLYLAEGAVGLPVFSPWAPPGFLHLLGPTGGYLLSYPFAAALTGLLLRRFSNRGFAPSLLAAATGSLFILLCGAAWFGILTHQSVGAVLTLAVLPFLAGDTLKVVAAAAVASGVRRFRRA